MAGNPQGQYAALIAFAKNEATSLTKVFQTALTYSLAFRATSAIDSSADNIVVMVGTHLRVLCCTVGEMMLTRAAALDLEHFNRAFSIGVCAGLV